MSAEENMPVEESAAYFLGYESASLEDALFSIIPAPYEGASTYVRGQAAAPWSILAASGQIENYDEESSLSLVDMGIHVNDPALAPLEEGVLRDWTRDRIWDAIDATTVPVILGGDGTVSLWGIEALLEHKDKKGNYDIEGLTVLHIDGNADLNEPDEDDEGNLLENNHTVMRRVLELDRKVMAICQVGIRAMSRAAFNCITDDDTPVETFFMSDLERMSTENWHDDVVNCLSTPVYLSIDLNGLDPSVIPSVSNPEPGGLHWWSLLRLLKKVVARRRIAAFDITELCPKEGLI